MTIPTTSNYIEETKGGKGANNRKSYWKPQPHQLLFMEFIYRCLPEQRLSRAKNFASSLYKVLGDRFSVPPPKIKHWFMNRRKRGACREVSRMKPYLHLIPKYDNLNEWLHQPGTSFDLFFENTEAEYQRFAAQFLSRAIDMSNNMIEIPSQADIDNAFSSVKMNVNPMMRDMLVSEVKDEGPELTEELKNFPSYALMLNEQANRIIQPTTPEAPSYVYFNGYSPNFMQSFNPMYIAQMHPQQPLMVFNDQLMMQMAPNMMIEPPRKGSGYDENETLWNDLDDEVISEDDDVEAFFLGWGDGELAFDMIFLHLDQKLENIDDDFGSFN
eukprot:TRINITY_DN9919_c0_g1_i1.p1 TRINITY_DN9919_c0_g1~~TRINITY_DN9919_c0_g1_i1.p1  ORF type:complete len:338 (+),score=94.62 TRINITY_DN9919_c0_g1_i1:33-1016(+)